MFKKTDLKTGMIIKTRQKELFIFFKNKNGNSIFLNEESMIPLRYYRSDLTSTMSILDDVVEVYDIPNNFLSNLKSICSRENLIMNTVVDWENIPIDTKIIYSSKTSSYYNRGHFAKYENGKIYIYKQGGTSWTKESCETFCIDPRHVRLLKETFPV